MIRIIGGKIVDFKLPETAENRFGDMIVDYHLQSEEELRLEGWLPLEDRPPLVDRKIEYYIPSSYEVHYDKVVKTYEVKPLLEIPVNEEEKTASLYKAMRELIRVDDLTAEELEDLIFIYEEYKVDYDYNAGDVFQYEGKLYKVIQGHKSQEDWKPDELPALYLNIMPDNVIDYWEERHGANAYKVGAKVISSKDDKVYELIIAGWQAYEPPNEGWKEVV